MRAAGIDIGTTTISGVVLDTEAKKRRRFRMAALSRLSMSGSRSRMYL